MDSENYIECESHEEMPENMDLGERKDNKM